MTVNTNNTDLAENNSTVNPNVCPVMQHEMIYS